MSFSLLFIITAFSLQADTLNDRKLLDTRLNTAIEQMSLREAVDRISATSGVRFVYGNSLTESTNKISLSVADKTLGEVLDELLERHGYAYEVVSENEIAIYKQTHRKRKSLALQQGWVLKGNVINEAGEPMPGVSVRVKNTMRGTTTDVDGTFMLEINSGNEVLVFSFIGYLPEEIAVGNRQELSVSLQPDLESQAINEVVVVGFGTQKKISVTGAISNVSVQDMERTSTPSLSNAIAGRLPGIITRQSSGEPGADAANVFIRGLGTFGTARGPLVLVDGVERNMNNLNVEEIESFSILKDASATAVYGVRGANGVILINTKRGVVGKPKITFRTEVARLSPLRLPDYINGAEYASLMNEGLVADGLDPQFSDEDIALYRSGTDPYFHPDVDWIEEVFSRVTHQTVNNLNVRGGNNTVKYFTNVGYTLQDGIYKTDNLNEYNTNALIKRYNFRSNVDVSLSSSLTINLGVGGIIRYGNYPGSGSGTGTGSTAIFDALRITSPIAFPIRNPDGSPGGVASTGELGTSNPWGMVMHSGYVRQDRNVLQGTFGARWDLSSLVTEGLSIRGLFSYDHYYQGDQMRRKNFEVKGYLGQNADGEDVYQVYREASALGYSVSHDVNRRLYTETAVNYSRTFGDHDVSGMILGNLADNINLSAAASVGNLPQRRLGVASRVTYGYQRKYFAELNLGYNGSENFPKGNRFGFFPAISAGWVVSNENFWHVDAVTQLKVRGSYGLVGNDQIGERFLYVSRVNRNGPDYRFGEGQQLWNGFAEGYIANPDVTWEIAQKANVGFDLALLNNRLVLQVDAFRDLRSNILTQRRTVPVLAGYIDAVVPYANIGKVKNRGMDAMLEVKNQTQKGWFYSFRGNFTFARNERLETDQPVQPFEYLSEIGQPIGRPLGLVALGLFQSDEEIANSPTQTYSTPRVGDIKYKDLNNDGFIDDFDRTFIGYPRTPEVMFGFGGTVAYKGVDVSIFFNGATRTSTFIDGRSIYPYSQGFGQGNLLREYYDNRWTEANPQGHYPRAGSGNNLNNFRTSTHYLRDASYVRLRNAEVGYTLPEQLTERWHIAKIRMFINGMNLYTWDSIKVIDPESNYGTGGYPLQSSVNFGLLVNF